jgi:hypothetical protein
MRQGQPRSLARQLAATIQARLNCLASGNAEWKLKHEDRIRELTKLLPSGSGLDNGCRLDLGASTGEKLVIETAFHHMDQHGYYDGWTEHTITVRASLISELDIHVSGRNRNEIKDYLAETFAWQLERIYIEEYDETTDSSSYREHADHAEVNHV